MPPAKKRARRYDSAKLRRAVLTQYGTVRTAVARLTPEQLAGRAVREPLARLHRAAGDIVVVTEAPEPAPGDDLLAPERWPYAAARAAAEGGDPPQDTYEAVAEAVTGTADTRRVATGAGPMRFPDYLVTRIVALTVHTDELNEALEPAGITVPLDREALATTTRLLADALATEAPGGSVELRIPPYAVVQCVEGPRHTRGTPPNVVETDPLSWLRLATGRLTWPDALHAAKLSASGDRADLSALLPLLP